MRTFIFRETLGCASLIGWAGRNGKLPKRIEVSMLEELTPSELELINEDIEWLRREGVEVVVKADAEKYIPIIKAEAFATTSKESEEHRKAMKAALAAKKE